MRVKVQVFAQLREKLKWGEKWVELNKNNASLRDVLSSLPELAKWVVEGDKIRDDFIVLVNGLNVRFTGGLDTKVSDGDEIAIFPPGGGG